MTHRDRVNGEPMPSKTLLRSSATLAEADWARRLAASRVKWTVDFPKISRRGWWMARGLGRTPEEVVKDAALHLERIRDRVPG